MNLPLNVNISIIIISLSSLATLVKVMMALATYASYVVMFDIPLDIINSYIQERISPDKHLKAEYLLRLGLVLFTFSLAAGVPRLDLFISLVGSASSSTLALMAPPIIDTVTAGEKCSRARLMKNSLIFLFGIVGFASGTFVSIRNIIKYFVYGN